MRPQNPFYSGHVSGIVAWYMFQETQNEPYSLFKSLKEKLGTSLAVQWLGLRAFTAKGLGLIPGRATNPTSRVARPKKKKSYI